MALIFIQTDTAADNGATAGCSGATTATAPASREISSGSAAGSTEISITIGNTETNVYALIWQTDVDEPGQVLWNSGDYVVRNNVTAANANVQWTATHICERTSGGTYNSVASLTGQTTSLGTTGVKTHTVNRGTDFNAAAANSTLYIVCLMTNAGKGGQVVGITPNQNIDTPITQVEPLIVLTSPVSASFATQDPGVVLGTISYVPTPAAFDAQTQNPDVVQSSLILDTTPALMDLSTVDPKLIEVLRPSPAGMDLNVQNPIIVQSSVSIVPTPISVILDSIGPDVVQSSISVIPDPASIALDTELGAAAGGIPQRLTSVTQLRGATRIYM